MTIANQSVQTIPPTIDHVIGQPQVVSKLKIGIDAAYADNEPLPHVLLTGPPGTGKSMLARVIASEMASQCHEALGQTVASLPALNGLLLSNESHQGLIYLDEAHQIPPIVQVALYKAIDERAVYLTDTSGSKISKIDLVPFTLVLATTDPQGLLPPLRDRMRLHCQLRRYEVCHIQSILSQKIAQLEWNVEEGVLQQIAERSFGTPRISLRILESVRRVARSEGELSITTDHAKRTFVVEELDDIGLGSDERRYLEILSSSSKPIRIGVVASRMGQPVEAVSKVVESNLLWLGLIDRSDRGRSLTAAGLSHVHQSHSVYGENNNG